MIVISILSLIGVITLVFEYIFHHKDKQKIFKEIKKLEKDKQFLGSQYLKKSSSIKIKRILGLN